MGYQQCCHCQYHPFPALIALLPAPSYAYYILSILPPPSTPALTCQTSEHGWMTDRWPSRLPFVAASSRCTLLGLSRKGWSEFTSIYVKKGYEWCYFPCGPQFLSSTLPSSPCPLCIYCSSKLLWISLFLIYSQKNIAKSIHKKIYRCKEKSCNLETTCWTQLK